LAVRNWITTIIIGSFEDVKQLAWQSEKGKRFRIIAFGSFEDVKQLAWQSEKGL
jgi:hypothetical protein